MLLGFQNGPSTFLSLFFLKKIDFSYYFLKKKRDISMSTQREKSVIKIIALKVERVQNTFENLNFSKMTLKMLKTMQIYQK